MPSWALSLILRVVWLLLSLFVVVLTVASFAVLIRGGRFELLFDQGPLALNPQIYDRLRQLFGPTTITTTQLLVHGGGAALFTAIALVVAGRLDSRARLGPSVTLITLGAALFAPLGVLAREEPAWAPAVAVLGVFSPGDPRFWRSLAGLLLVAFALLFPDGRIQPRWARPIAAGFVALVVLWTLFPMSPFAVTSWPSVLQTVWALGIPLGLAGAQAWRYFRHSGPEQRIRTRLVLVALLAVVGAFLVLWVLRPELQEDAFGLVLANPRMQAIYDVNLLVLLTAAVFLFPVSLFVSVVRYRLFDIDLIINRALVYGAITAVGGLSFVGVTATIASLLPEEGLFGLPAGSAGLITGIVLVAAFQPIRSVVQRAVDRRFYRGKYDGELAVRQFAERNAEVVDPQAVRDDVVSVAGRILGVDRLQLNPPVEMPVGSAAVDLTRLDQGSPLLPLASQGWAMAVPVGAVQAPMGTLLIGRRLDRRPFSAIEHRLMEALATEAGPALRLAELIHRQEQTARRQEGVDRELAMARRIQLDLLPKQLPEIPGWHLGVYYEPAREVGGDFYDVIALDDGRWAVVIGDVADKGVPAAMVMATCRTLLRGAAAARGRTPGSILTRVNQLLHPDVPAGMFATCLCLTLDPPSGEIVIANAGHPLPYLVSGEASIELRARGLPLGLLPNADYEEVKATIDRGVTLLLASDGIFEAHDPFGQMFGFGRLREATSPPPGGGGMIGPVLATLSEFVGPGWTQEDDVTLVELSRLP